jgi:hypothetical protein
MQKSLRLERSRRDNRHERIRSDENNDWRNRKLREQSVTGDGVRGVWRIAVKRKEGQEEGGGNEL